MKNNNLLQSCTIVSSLYSKKYMTQAGIAYLITAFSKANLLYDLIDLSGSLDYYDSPNELYSKPTSPKWLNPDSIKQGAWMDKYLPCSDEKNDVVFFSSIFSPDVVFHARHSYNIKQKQPDVVTAIGGCAISSMNQAQIEFLSQFFDYILIGYDIFSLLDIVLKGKKVPLQKCIIEKRIAPPKYSPDYSLVSLGKLVTVYSGHGCYYGGCRFCDYPSRSYQKIFFRTPAEVAFDVNQIHKLNPNVEDIVLTQDSYTKKNLIETANEIKSYGGKIPYNLMMRAERWISDEIGEILQNSGCTDIFIGAEALDDYILSVLNKGVSVNDIFHSVKCLSKYVDITIGLILFVPGVNKKSLDNQLENIKKLLPHISSIEPEVLTVVQGSEFAQNPTKYGIQLNSMENLLNDSWCFGLSQDIPWSMSDISLVKEWFCFCKNFKEICYTHVEYNYWHVIEELEESLIENSKN